MKTFLKVTAILSIVALIFIYCYTQKTKLNSHYADLFYHLGSQCSSTCSPQKKLYYFRKAVHYNPLLKEGYYEMGRAFDELKEYKMALHSFQKAAQLDFRYTWAHFEVGRHYFEYKNPDDALRYLLQSEKYGPYYDQLHYYIGKYCQYKNIQIGAKNHFSYAVKFNPNHALAHEGLAMAEYELGNREAFQQEIDKLRILNRMDLVEHLEEFKGRMQNNL